MDYYSQLSQEQRGALSKKLESPQEEHSFQPQLNQRSLQMAKRMKDSQVKAHKHHPCVKVEETYSFKPKTNVSVDKSKERKRLKERDNESVF